MSDPTFAYHRGELNVQARAGVRALADRVARGIHPVLPTAGSRFLSARPMVFVAATDPSGRPVATVLTGEPGFIEVPDAWTVRIHATPAAGDPAAEALSTGGHAGLLAIDFGRRQRIRVNGTLHRDPDGALRVSVEQAYSNCQQYIQAREPGRTPAEHAPARAVRGRVLTGGQREWIATADTFFIASASADGADMSHRGGMPGFVRVEGGRISWGDYGGNAMFNTLGNLAANPRAALLFADFERGRTLHVAGSAAIDWSPDRAAAYAGAERVVDLIVEDVVEREGVPLPRLRLTEYSPFNPGNDD